MYVVFEGIDGGGKSTILKRIADRLRQRQRQHAIEHYILTHRFPSPITHVAEDPGGGIGRIIRDVMEGKRELDHQCFMYLFMTEAIQAEGWIREHRKSPWLLFVDRHASTTGPIYQQDHHPKEDVQAVYRSHRFEVPDAILVFDIDYQTHVTRRRARNNQHEDLVFERDDEARFARMRSEYLGYLRGEHHQFPKEIFHRIDANRTVDEVEEQAWNQVRRIL